MSKQLIIAEKPSVAADIAKALGGFSKKGEFFESDDFVLSSAVGHLLEIVVPEGQEVKRGKWNLVNLPIIPTHFDLRPIEKSAPRLKVLLRLIKRKDVEALVNACDAGREGELIFRYIAQFAGTSKPIQRLWLQSMTQGAIRDAFAALRADAEMQPLADAAVCRSEADWLVGINGTRAMTAFNSKLGGFQLTTVGRVQTPTLMIVVEREEKIKKFVPRDYWELHATFQAAAGDYPGRWFDEAFPKGKSEVHPPEFTRLQGGAAPEATRDGDAKPERLWDAARAEAIRAKCLGKSGVVTEESKPATQLSPLLFDLTSLQREANGRFGYSAKRTLQLAQALYERHKVLTYPRTDARALPEDYLGAVKKTLSAMASAGYGELAERILKQSWVHPNKRIFNNAKISDHFAIIPTAQMPTVLSEEESKIYDLVARRFLAVFYPAAEFLVTTRITRVEAEPFKTEGKVLVIPGWMVVYGKEAHNEETPNLTAVQEREIVQTRAIECVGTQTKPPPRYTEATLLTAMEGAGKLVEDDELREAMSAKGLGTPATRASIIEGLIYEKYMLRRGRELQATAKAFSLAALLRGLQIPELCSPELTGDWEFKLKQMEHSQLPRAEFMQEIAAMTRRIVDQTKKFEHDTVPGDFSILKAPCPKCAGEIHENYRRFQCQKCDFFIWKTLAGRQFEVAEMEDLLTKKSVGPLDNFHSHKGKVFAAMVKLSPEYKVEFDFGTAAGDEVVDFSGKEPLGKCPKCGAGVYENGSSYVCEKAVGAKRTCTFRCGTVILKQIVDKTQLVKLLTTGKTDLLTRFISRKGRPFRAYLVVRDGQVGFEFINSKKKPAQTSSVEKTDSAPKPDSAEKPG
ncbi:MAG: DNA topoisomerase III [Kiritimatiellaeota bacterium]|nr:DNA topoisomerase III [Kiritimatiellota bacterium]